MYSHSSSLFWILRTNITFAFPGHKDMLKPRDTGCSGWADNAKLVKWPSYVNVQFCFWFWGFFFFLNQVYRVFIILIVLHILESKLSVVIALLFFIWNLLIFCQYLIGQFKKKYSCYNHLIYVFSKRQCHDGNPFVSLSGLHVSMLYLLWL